MKAAEIQLELETAIPISRAMGLRILELTPQKAVIRCEFEPNVNHVGSVFGGSLYCAGALACYALFRSLTESHGYAGKNLVIQQGRIQYLKPVTGPIIATATAPDRLAVEGFLAVLRRRSKARLNLVARIGEGEAIFIGDYVYQEG